MKVLVTGGAGFIGSAIARDLLSAGHRVRVFDDFSTGFRGNLPTDATLEVVEGSILDRAALERALEGCEAVSHQAAMVSVPLSIESPERCRALNAEGTRAVLEAARALGIRRACFASSAAVYGNDVLFPVRESAPTNPASPYGASKLEAEHLASVVAENGLRVVALRYFNVFGPRQALSGGYPALVAALANAAASGSEFTLYGDGLQTRDLVPVADVARANRLALEAEGLPSFYVANVGTGEERSVLDVISAIEKTSGASLRVTRKPDRPGDVRRSVCDPSAAEAFGWRAEKPFLDAVSETYAHYAGLHGARREV